MEELQTELEQLYMIDATIYQPLYEMIQVRNVISCATIRSDITLVNFHLQ